jgi:hypothetical protein
MAHYAPGAAVEVLGLESDGFARAFFEGTLLPPSSSRAAADAAPRVRLTHFREADGSPCVEAVPLARLRPAPPPSLEADLQEELADLFPPGAAVDAWVNELWWEGTVVARARGRGVDVLHPGARAAREAARARPFVSRDASAGTPRALARAARGATPRRRSAAYTLRGAPRARMRAAALLLMRRAACRAPQRATRRT